MKHWKLIGAGAGIAAAAALSFSLLKPGDPSASEDSASPNPPENKSLFSRFSREPERVTLPANAKLPIRLEHAISSEKNSSGDTFTGWLDGPLTVDGKLLAPSHSKIIGRLTQVKDSGRVEGVASLTMVVEKLVVDGKEYDLETLPVARAARRTRKKDAAIIGGSAAAGGVIGAIAGGGKGAAIGALVGAGAGTAGAMMTGQKDVKFPAESVLRFTLKEEIKIQ